MSSAPSSAAAALAPHAAHHDLLLVCAHGLSGAPLGGRQRTVVYRAEANRAAAAGRRVAQAHNVDLDTPAWTELLHEARALNTAPSIVSTALAFASLGRPCALCGAPGASPIPEAKVVDPYLREQLTRATQRHQRRVLSAGTLVCEDCDRGVFCLPSTPEGL